ncbi:MAG: NADH-quinone oxidoreductase subunit E [Selenomonas sp.]|jgi:hydrogenase-4 component B|nr:NADH-quinone oxidoreductase subunit E [Selenomonas sp.]
MILLFAALAVYGLGALTMLWPKRLELGAHYVGTVLAAVASGMVLVAAVAYLCGLSVGWLSPAVSGLLADWGWGSYSLVADGWSAAFLVITGLAGFIISLYALDYAKAYRGNGLRRLTGLWNLFLGSMVLVLAAGDAFTFMLAWEVMALVSFLLVNHESRKKGTVKAAYQYMVMTHLGTAAILAAFYLLGSASDSLAFADLARNTLEGPLRHAAFGAAFIGFALKAGLMPLHVWLPNAHPAAPSHVSALMSGVMLKMAVYGFGRFIFYFLGMQVLAYGVIVLLVGLISAFLGVLYATMAKDMKRILAYSSVENMGIIFATFGCGMLLVQTGHGVMALVAFAAVLVHSLSHSLMKALLFMSAGAVMHATGTKNVELLGGLAKRMPWTAAFTLVGAMSLSSLPFTSGLIGEWMALQSFITLGWQTGTQEMRLLVILAFILLGLTGALALGCFVRLYGVVFLGRRRSSLVLRAQEMPFFMLLGMGLEAVLIVGLGIFPVPLVGLMTNALSGAVLSLPLTNVWAVVWNGTGNLVDPAAFSCYNPLLLLLLALVVTAALAMALEGPGVLVRRDVTWNCGTVPTRRQQYTATGFSKPLRRAFDRILRPRRERVFLHKEHAYFGRRVQYNLFIPDQFTERLYVPVQRLMIGLSSWLRLLQQGNVRLYIGYIMLAMVAVLIWGVM